MPKCAQIAVPLNRLLRDEKPCTWTEEYQKCLDALQNHVISECWESMILTFQLRSKQTPQDLLLGQSCPEIIQMADTQWYTCAVQWLHLKLSSNPKTRAPCFDIFSQELETLSLAPGNYSLHGSILTVHLGNKQRSVREVIPFEWTPLRVSSLINYREGRITSYLVLTVLQNPWHVSDEWIFWKHPQVFSATAEDEPPLTSVISVISWFSPRPQIVYPEKLQTQEILKELHDAPFADHTGAPNVYADLRKNINWTRMEEDIETYR